MPEKQKEYRAIGLMSGTSLDGIDAALLRTDGENHLVRETFLSIPYTPELREKIRACFNSAPDKDCVRDLTLAHAEAVRRLLSLQGLHAHDIDLIGFHGQTISHAPERGHTCQMGDGRLLAELTGISVVNDFRTADVKAGGQGAPLVPVYHQALAAGLQKPIAFLNIGGVANITYIGTKGEVIAFDTGAGNALLDDWMREKTKHAYDTNGDTGRSGKKHEKILAQLLAHSYFTTQPPKSLDRNTFVSTLLNTLSLQDGAATLAAFTVQGVVKSLSFLPEKPRRWIVCGGGRLNTFFMEELEKNLGSPADPIEDLGLDGDATEAEAFAYLAVRSLRGLPLSFPLTTGVKNPTQGGVLHPVPEMSSGATA
jgi:anhydro-N-acetylmuramic acid kinase